jgi:hypothetical protein
VTDHVPESRRQIGIVIRSPLVFLLGFLWYGYIWWWVFGFSLAASAAVLVLLPIAYPFAYIIELCVLAFKNSGDPVLPTYWRDYPKSYLKWCRTCFELGFRTLRRWLLTGFA